mmetsp:Transcript_36702/g.92764  ORF Transcript_36702/g.92764 Transcript_36702/m.92764 type:complete len:309 (-) Transcript_36702:649-1575(-)
MHVAPPCLNVCFSSRLSKLASRASPTFSISTGLPNGIAFSSVRRKLASVSLTTMRPRSFSMLRMNLLAAPCGSMQSGQREPRYMQVPFSAEKPSLGRPYRFHCRVSTGSPSTVSSLKPGVQGIPRLSSSATHSWHTSFRYEAVKGPRYAIWAAASSTSPVRVWYSLPRRSAAAVQRVFSPPSPVMSFCARSSLTPHMCTCWLRLSLLFFLAVRSSSSACSLSSTSFSAACFSASAPITTASSFSAPASLIFLGSTTLTTRSYASMARTQQQRPYAALDTLRILLGSKSGFSTYTRILEMVAVGMWSLS